ncbi:MAG: crotonase/enoyl-CoA hydratase family protein [Hyphomicrobiales bacterium]
MAPAGRLGQAVVSKTPTQLEFWSSAKLAPARERVAADRSRIGFGTGLASAGYRELDLTIDPHDEAIWCFMRPVGPPSFTPTLLRELISMRRTLQRMFANLRPGEAAPIKYFVGGSRIPGIYNLGGDLSFFIECIRARNLEALRNYAHDCVDVAYHMTVGFHLPLVTIALVQGDALGGGFEGALSFNVLVAEKTAKFGLPEILFNLFPGMGAFSFLSRKLDAARAHKMIVSGRIYSATELYEMGLIDVLAEEGRGEEAVRDYIVQNRRQHTVHQRIRDVSMRVNPLSLDELHDVTEIWAEHAMRLAEPDLRNMERLASAQLRRVKRLHP